MGRLTLTPYTASHRPMSECLMHAAFAAYGLPAPVLVVQQCTPDPDFPTVRYPNPEEGKGALQLAMDTAGACLDLGLRRPIPALTPHTWLPIYNRRPGRRGDPGQRPGR